MKEQDPWLRQVLAVSAWMLTALGLAMSWRDPSPLGLLMVALALVASVLAR